MNRRVILRSTQLESFSPWILQMGWSKSVSPVSGDTKGALLIATIST
jgi:hypothetical protein